MVEYIIQVIIWTIVLYIVFEIIQKLIYKYIISSENIKQLKTIENIINIGYIKNKTKSENKKTQKILKI